MPVCGFSPSCACVGGTCTLSLHVLQIYTPFWMEAVPGNTGPGTQPGAGGWEGRSELFCLPGDWEPQQPKRGEGGLILERHY